MFFSIDFCSRSGSFCLEFVIITAMFKLEAWPTSDKMVAGKLVTTLLCVESQ